MILFLDDERRIMDSYVRELEFSGYQVAFQSDVDTALKFFEENLPQIDLIILDIMMPAGSTFKDVDTRQGLRTGLYMYEKIRQKASNVPVIILTNVSDEKVAERFRSENKCWFFRKEDYLPFELAQQIDEMVSERN
jgi:DNA-binding response OmpR family regulator